MICAARVSRRLYGLQRREVDSRVDRSAICVYDDAGNVIETHEHVGDFKEW